MLSPALRAKNPQLYYLLCDQTIKEWDTFTDLDVLYSAICNYPEHISTRIFRGRHTASAGILEVFFCRYSNIHWPTIASYIKQTIIYGSCAWSLIWKGQSCQLEKIQRWFTK